MTWPRPCGCRFKGDICVSKNMSRDNDCGGDYGGIPAQNKRLLEAQRTYSNNVCARVLNIHGELVPKLSLKELEKLGAYGQ